MPWTKHLLEIAIRSCVSFYSPSVVLCISLFKLVFGDKHEYGR
jgi:hypothetical protein